jgi:hypothetical protein
VIKRLGVLTGFRQITRPYWYYQNFIYFYINNVQRPFLNAWDFSLFNRSRHRVAPALRGGSYGKTCLFFHARHQAYSTAEIHNDPYLIIRVP